MMIKNKSEKTVVWLGGSKKDLMSLPTEVCRFFGHALSLAQFGERHDAAKPLKGFGSAGVLEIIEDYQKNTYRAVYTIKFKEAVFVLHVFQKKSKQSIATPRPDMQIIRKRIKVAENIAREMRNGNTNS